MPIFLSNKTIRLRGVEPSDLGLLFETESDIDAWPDSDTHAPITREALSRYIDSYAANPFGDEQLRMIAEDIDSSRPVGVLDLYDISPIHRRAFVGIYILPEERRKGYASAILEAAVQYAERRLNLRSLAARVLTDNIPSSRLFSNCGFSLSATLPSWHFADGIFHDTSIYIRNLQSV